MDCETLANTLNRNKGKHKSFTRRFAIVASSLFSKSFEITAITQKSANTIGRLAEKKVRYWKRVPKNSRQDEGKKSDSASKERSCDKNAAKVIRYGKISWRHREKMPHLRSPPNVKLRLIESYKYIALGGHWIRRYTYAHNFGQTRTSDR